MLSERASIVETPFACRSRMGAILLFFVYLDRDGSATLVGHCRYDGGDQHQCRPNCWLLYSAEDASEKVGLNRNHTSSPPKSRYYTKHGQRAVVQSSGFIYLSNAPLSFQKSYKMACSNVHFLYHSLPLQSNSKYVLLSTRTIPSSY